MKRNDSFLPGMRFALIASLCLSLIAILYTFSTGISGNDFWWHVKVGEWVVENGKIPTSDIFSWYAAENNAPWVAHEWLSDVIFYFIYAYTGSLGIFLLSLMSAVTMLFLLWKQAAHSIQKNILISGLFFAIFAVSTSVFFYGRPHLFSFFLLYFELKLLYAFIQNPSSKGIYCIPLIACLWSNIHGGSSNLSYLLCIAFLFVGCLKMNIGCMISQRLERKAIVRLSVVIVLSMAAILLNPVGVKMLLYPYQNMGDKLMLAVISEWRAPDAKNWGDLILFYFPVVLMLLGFFAERNSIKMIDFVIMGVFVLLFLRSVRFIMLWNIAASFCAFQYLPECKIKPVKPKVEKMLIILCVLVLIISMGASALTVKETIDDGQLISTVLSDDAIEKIKTAGPNRLFNDYNLGEALIFNDIPVFFDARADVYAYENMLADGVSLMLLEQANAEEDKAYVDVDVLVERYKFDAILILKSRPLYSFLISHPGKYVCAFEDENIAYFEVFDSQA